MVFKRNSGESNMRKDKGKNGEILEINRKLKKVKLNRLIWLKNI